MNLYYDIFNRRIQVGDLLLINKEHTKRTYTHRLFLAKVNEEYGLDFTSPILNNFYNDDNIFDCYKIKDSTGEILKIYESGYVSPVLLGKKNMWDDDCITDILGRPIYAGDFIMYLDSYSKLVHNHIKYGIVIDPKHIFNEKSTVSKINHVYKIVDKEFFEENIYNSLLSEYKKHQYLQINNTDKELEQGDVFRTNNNLYIYIGEYNFDIICNNTSIDFSDKVKDAESKKHKVYLKFDLNRTKAVNLYNSLNNFQCSQEQITSYIKSSGISSYFTASFGMPNVYKFDISKKRRGVYMGSIYFPYKIDCTYINKSNNLEISYKFF